MSTATDTKPANETTPPPPPPPTRAPYQSVDDLINESPEDGLPGCPSIVVYENKRENLVIRQDGAHGDDDAIVEVPYDRLPKLIAILQRWNRPARR